MQAETDNYDEATGWNENVYTRSPSVNNLRMSRFRRSTSTACLFNIITTTALIIMTIVALVYALSYYGVWNNNSDLGIVTMFCGQIKGVQQGDHVLSYLGIPYALPPIGENRFKPPVQLSSKELCHKAWQLSNTTVINSIYHTQEYKSPCLQLLPKSAQNPFIGNENCLYLNIHIPINKRSIKSLKPVIIILDGLFFMYNNEPKQPSLDTVQKTDAIHITFNYRLGPLGFLPHPHEKTPNLGLHDQLLVLKWIRNNIGQFGGDPLNVILFGYGSGATCALALLYSPISNQLFDKLWITAPGLGLSNKSIEEVIQMTNYLLDCQNALDPHQCSSQKLKNPADILNVWNWTIVEQWLIQRIFSLPMIQDINNFPTEKSINILINDNKFVNIDFWNRIIHNNIKPMVFGQTSHEVAVYPTPKTVPFWDKSFFKSYILSKLKISSLNPYSQYYQQLLSNTFSNFNCAYLGGFMSVDDIDDDDDDNGDLLSNLMSLITDSRVTCPLTELVNTFINSYSPIYQYYLTGTHRSFDPYSLRGFVPYAFHGWDAMLYLRTYEVHNDFTDPSLLQSLAPQENDHELTRLKRTSDLLNSAMYAFARTGMIPSWYKSEKGNYIVNLIANDQLCKYVNIMEKRCDFWRLLFENNLFNSTWRF